MNDRPVGIAECGVGGRVALDGRVGVGRVGIGRCLGGCVRIRIGGSGWPPRLDGGRFPCFDDGESLPYRPEVRSRANGSTFAPAGSTDETCTTL